MYQILKVLTINGILLKKTSKISLIKIIAKFY